MIIEECALIALSQRTTLSAQLASMLVLILRLIYIRYLKSITGFFLLDMLIVILVNLYSLNQGEKLFCINYVISSNASVLNYIDLLKIWVITSKSYLYAKY